MLTVSDTRTDATDTSGRAIRDMLTAAGHHVEDAAIVKDEPADVMRVGLGTAVARANVQVIITTGGTGLTSRDGTYEAITELLDKRLDGFGELFRMISYQDIGARGDAEPRGRRHRARQDRRLAAGFRRRRPSGPPGAAHSRSSRI